MTDINELAQRMKAAALKAIADEGPTWFSKDQLSHPEGIALHEADVEFMALASHENVLALVEALEAAQKTSAARLGAIDTTHKMFQRERDRAEKAEKRIAELPSQKRLIGWRMADYTDETADPALAKNWATTVDVLPIFEGDVNTKLSPAAAGKGE